MFTIIQEFTEKYCGFRGSLFSIHPLSGCERLRVRRQAIRQPCGKTLRVKNQQGLVHTRPNREQSLIIQDDRRDV